MPKTTAIYPGTFDPVTFGHLDVLERASGLFDKVIIAAAKNPNKETLFTEAERTGMIKAACGRLKNVEVESFSGLLVNYAKSKKAEAIIRGLRAVSDFEYEFQMALTNRTIAPGIETVFLMPNEKYSFISSSLVREIAKYGGDVSGFVPGNVALLIKSKF